MTGVLLYKGLGQLIRNQDIGLEYQSEIRLLLDKEATGIYVVKVNTTAGSFSKKVILK